jgi:FAD binding domain
VSRAARSITRVAAPRAVVIGAGIGGLAGVAPGGPGPAAVSTSAGQLDAAHPMTSNLGQGGCQALEDAVVLARLAASPDPAAVPPLLARYTAARLPRTTQVTRWTRRAASMTTWTAAPAIAIRNTITLALGKLPVSAALRGLAQVYDWQPPASA